MQSQLFPWLQAHLAIPETVLAEWPDHPMLTVLATAVLFSLQKFSISFLSLLNVFISLLKKYKKHNFTTIAITFAIQGLQKLKLWKNSQKVLAPGAS